MIIDDGKSNNNTCSPPPSDFNMKRKRRAAGTPDLEAEVVRLSASKLLESARYMCKICGQGFHREQNLQMHRRRHNLPWKMVKKAARKRVYVCPEETCLHHQAAHALGDLVGIKKHFRRKHSGLRQWTCAKCSKAYAVHSDFKAHHKTCSTRGHSCYRGRVFSKVESFIEHEDVCRETGQGRLHGGKRLSMEAEIEKALADEARREARTEMDKAERDLSEARRIRQHARAELDKANALRDHAADTIRAALLQITCHACKPDYIP